jgi:hypothetical protein
VGWVRRHKVIAGVIAILLVLLAGAFVDLLRIKWDLENGREALSGLQIDNLDDGLVPTIDTAVAHLDDADDLADGSPFLTVLGAVPIVRGQVHAVRDLTQVGVDLGKTATSAANAIDVVLQEAGAEASARVTLLDTVLEQLDVIEATIDDIDVGAGGRLLGPLATARKKVDDTLADAPDRLDEARFQVEGLRDLLAGPSRYLVLAANNAEMRGGAGMPLSGGVVSIENGDIEFGEFIQLAMPYFEKPDFPYPSEWPTTYFRWDYGVNFLETAVSPNFGTTGPLYTEMAAKAGFGEVDGVLEIDVVALRHLIEVIGPVDFDGQTYDESNIEQQILNENYIRFGDAEVERPDRVQLQSALATKIFDAFKERDIPVADLALALRNAAQGRHLMAYAKDPAVQDLWESIDADGVLDPNTLMVTVQNISANKLDWYIDPEVVLNVLPGIDGSWRGRLTVIINNPEVERTSRQVDGYYQGLTGGDHRALVAVYLPGNAYNVRTLDLPFSEDGIDPPTYMLGKRVEIPRGETRRVALEFSVPPEQIAALIVPSGRVRPVQYTVNNQVVTDAATIPVFWVQPSEPDTSAGAPAVAALLALFGALTMIYGVRSRMLAGQQRPIRPLNDLALHAPSLGALLFLGAVATLLVGALISGAT